ncbi:MAG: nicotinamidase [Micavibrio sp.]|nr:nicotinamidase [Micavibrio sp.]|tara:strand:+ start:630 stop:1358 length:729 start_codon:yes stop_codon:yes gene_type:complete
MKTFPSHVAFLGIDPQLTFCEDGGLAVSGGHQIMPKLNELRSKSTKGYWTQDWHPIGHSSFASTHGREPFTKVWLENGQIVADYDDNAEAPKNAVLQILWPDHGIQGTEEAALHPILHVPSDDMILRKGNNPNIDSYSCVFENDKKTQPRFENGMTLPEQLREDGITTVVMGGLALDVCVRDGALDLKKEGFDVVVVLDASAAISSEGKMAAIKDFLNEGIYVCYSDELDSYFHPSQHAPAP